MKQKIKKIIAHVGIIYLIISLFILVKLEYRTYDMVTELDNVKIERDYYRDRNNQLTREIYGMNKELAMIKYADNKQTPEEKK